MAISWLDSFDASAPTVEAEPQASAGSFAMQRHMVAHENQRYSYECMCCKSNFQVTGFNPPKCYYCGMIICESCRWAYEIPSIYLPGQSIEDACWRCQLKAELEFIEAIKREDLPVHIEWNWCTDKGRDAFLKRLDVI